MSWNYRVVHTVHIGTDGESSETWEMCEVYYKEDGTTPRGYCVASVLATEVDNDEAGKGYAESLRWTLGEMLRAVDKPVLEASDFGGEE